MSDLLNSFASQALGNAMYRFTFGIVGDGQHGKEGHGLATGVGIYWREKYFIVTAAHAIQQTPFERTYFLLPDESLQFVDPDIVRPTEVKVRKRFELTQPQVILSESDDLAAFVLENQRQEQGRRHFYDLNDDELDTPISNRGGVLGYPGVMRIPVGENFMATPYVSFGEFSGLAGDKAERISMSYPKGETVPPEGLSGSGFWSLREGNNIVWAPRVSLVGLVTEYDPGAQSLLGCKVGALMAFLKANFDRFGA